MWPKEKETLEEFATRLYGKPLKVHSLVETPLMSETKIVEALFAYRSIRE